MVHVSVRADGSLLSCDIWLLTRGNGSAIGAQTSQSCEAFEKKGGRHGKAGPRLRQGPQTRQAAAGKLHQSVINEPTGRWDYMPNCTANQSIPK